MMDVGKLYLNTSKLIFLIYLPVTFLIWYSMLDGSGGGVTAFLTISVFAFSILFIKYQKLDINFTLFLFFIMYCFLYVVIYYVFFGDLVDGANRSLFSYHLIGILMYIVSYIIGRNYVEQNEKILIAIFFLMMFKVISNADLSVFRIDLSSVDDNLKGLYLGLSDIFCIFAIILVGTLKKQSWQIYIFILSILSLFILNSRSSLYIYIFSILFYFILFFRVSKILYLSTLVLIILFFYSSKLLSLLSENNRMFSVLSFDGADQSSQERASLSEQGLKQISEHMLLGDYGGVIKLHGDLGAYIHNIFSYWQNYGLIAFLLALYFFVYQTIKAGFKAYKYRENSKYHYVFILSIYLILTVLFTRSYNWYFAWFALGVVHNFLNIKFKKLSTV
ncbi:O-antigen ligase family protein [Acinetobacter baumannii]